MRFVRSLVFAGLAIAAIWLLDHPIGSIPPPGKILDPVHGFMANAEKNSDLRSYNFNAGNAHVKGTIYLDERLVPHIYAEDEHSLYFMQGYVHAKFRLWQMDIQTRAAAGELSEIFGPDFINYDKEQRNKGMIYGAEKAVEALSSDPQMADCIQAYCDGINAFITDGNQDNSPGLSYAEMPLEFKILNYKPTLWTPLKTALLLKYMANTLSGFDDDIEYSNLRQFLGEADFNLLFPDRPSGIDPIIPSEKIYDTTGLIHPALPDSNTANVFYDKIRDQFIEQQEKNEVGSNNWVAGPSKTKSGAPILCNDPHLQLNLPSLWFEIQLHAPGINCYGASLPGAPCVVIGFNDHIAWGVTNAGIDVLDWYQIEFKDAKKQSYRYGNEWKPLTGRVETIHVKGGKDVQDTVLYTDYGPLVFTGTETTKDKPDLAKQARAGLAMRWIAHDRSEEVKTFYYLNKAQDYDDYRKAISYFDCPAQNFVFGCTNGDIAITQQGKFPVKYPGEGRYILNGADPKNNYQEYIPFELHPYIKNPERGFCSSANQHPTDSTYPYYYTGYDFEFFRNRMINRSLTAMQNITPQDMMNLQQNNFNLLASEVLPKMLSSLASGKAPFEGTRTTGNIDKLLFNSLQHWNYYNDADSIAPACFQLWWEIFTDSLWDELHSTTLSLTIPDNYVTDLLLNNQPDTFPYYDIQSTPEKETLSDLLRITLTSTMDSINKMVDATGKGTKDLTELIPEMVWYKWKHTSIIHIAQLPAFSRLTVHNGGYRNIVNASSETHGPSWRMVVELTQPVKAWGVYPGGQSGNPGSRYYDNFIDDWASGKYNELHLYNDESEAKKSAKFYIHFN